MEVEIQSYLGSPYRYGGTTKAGMDCSGLIWRVYKDAAGIALPRKASDMFRFGYLINNGKWTFGDLLFFSTKGAAISHVGIYIGARRFVHVSESSGAIVSSLEEEYYRRRYRGARRIIR